VTEGVSAGRILARTSMTLRDRALGAGAALAAMAGLGVLIDSAALGESNAGSLNLVASGLTTAAGYLITKALVEDAMDRKLPARFPAYFGLGLLSTLGILVGTVALIVPGVLLFVRWSLSSPILLAADGGVTEAMQRSWAATGPYFWPILVAFLCVYGPVFGLGISAYALQGLLPGNVVPLILANLALNGGLIAGWHVAVAAYALLEGPDRLAATFA